MSINDQIHQLLQEAAAAQSRLKEIRATILNFKPLLKDEHDAIQATINDCYHVIELANMNAVGLTKATIKLRDCLRAGRDNKEASIAIQMLAERGCS